MSDVLAVVEGNVNVCMIIMLLKYYHCTLIIIRRFPIKIA